MAEGERERKPGEALPRAKMGASFGALGCARELRVIMLVVLGGVPCGAGGGGGGQKNEW
jgi:hypothetical protein